MKSLYLKMLDYILEVLFFCDGNRNNTAKILRISRRTLTERLDEARVLGYNIPLPKNMSQEAYQKIRTHCQTMNNKKLKAKRLRQIKKKNSLTS